MISLNETVVQLALNLAGNVMLQCFYNVRVRYKYCSYCLVVGVALIALSVGRLTSEYGDAGAIHLSGSVFLQMHVHATQFGSDTVVLVQYQINRLY